VIISCQKEYTCVCTSVSTGDRYIVEKVKTTKLGKKGFEKTCFSNETSSLKDCHVEP